MKIARLWHTVKYLKAIQLFSRFTLRAKRKLAYKHLQAPKCDLLKLDDLINVFPPRYSEKNTFEFLNLKKSFSDKIDWEFADYGRLWTYNLNYFEYLNQADMTREEGLAIIRAYVDYLPNAKTGLEPYPISLRLIFWMQFLIKNQVHESQLNDALYSQLLLLTKKIEYHLLGNHLLENAFSLLYGAYYFQDEKIYKKAKKILQKELKEQILADGAHFELSPMYHNIMLHRMLDCYNLIINNAFFDQELKALFKTKSEQMLAWMNQITFKNGDIPLVNDAAFGIAPTSQQLNQYAVKLGLNNLQQIRLKESAYRKFQAGKFDVLIDVGAVGPNYQPGHAHADTFNFLLNVNNRPVLVDTGTSTYQVNKDRFYERSTVAHNTVVIGNKNSSDVWSGHRVGKRAKVTILEDRETFVKAVHHGYSIPHERSWSVENDHLIITDTIQGEGIAYFHFAPDEEILINDGVEALDYSIKFQNAEKIEVMESYYAPKFNKKIKNKTLAVFFTQKLLINIQ